MKAPKFLNTQYPGLMSTIPYTACLRPVRRSYWRRLVILPGMWDTDRPYTEGL